MNTLEKHIRFIAEAIARHVYNTSTKVVKMFYNLEYV